MEKAKPVTDVVIISSAKPRERSAASVTLDRHLLDRDGYRLHVHPCEAREFPRFAPLRALLDRTKDTRLWKWANDLWFLINLCLPVHRLLPAPEGDSKNTVVLTVACGNGWLTAMKYAAAHQLPLVVRFDDWWPDCRPVQPYLNKLFTKHFLELHRKAAVSVCVSEGMRQELGEGAPTVVVLSIPEQGRAPAPPKTRELPARICYLGNMYDYGPMLAELATEARGRVDMRFEFRGTEPNWPRALKEELKASGQLHGFGEGEAFRRWFESFDFYLVAMFFDEHQRRRVRTCFSTKMMEYISMGRPIIVWAPEEAAAVQWARRTGAAHCVTDPSPRAVLAEIEKLAGSPEVCEALGRRAREVYEGEYSPAEIQKEFERGIDLALGRA